MTDLNLEARTMSFMLSQRGNGRWFFKMQKGLEAMYYIRASCGCRQDLEAEACAKTMIRNASGAEHTEKSW